MTDDLIAWQLGTRLAQLNFPCSAFLCFPAKRLKMLLQSDIGLPAAWEAREALGSGVWAWWVRKGYDDADIKWGG